jgi:alpha-D-ribose 1-methylphosphonate 5-triphosphate synthase subunit PhnH
MLAPARTLDGGFPDPVFDSQAIFRAVMNAMARPARNATVVARAAPPEPLAPLAGAVACTLLDADTSVWLDPLLAASDAVRLWLGFHTGARLVAAPVDATFALVGDLASMPPLDRFAQGTADYPDRSATLILQVESLEGGMPLVFRGPGIDGEAVVAPRGLPQDFVGQWAANVARFPRGVDLVLTAGDTIACLPRSARLVSREG